MGNGIKDINLILEKVIEEINEGKDKIFNITENVVAQAVGTAPSIGGSCDVKA